MNRRLLEELVRKEDRGNPLIINMISKRVRQLFKGDRAMIEDRQLTDPIDIAVREFLDGKLTLKKDQDGK